MAGLLKRLLSPIVQSYAKYQYWRHSVKLNLILNPELLDWGERFRILNDPDQKNIHLLKKP